MNVFGRFAITLRLKVTLLAIGVFPLICGSALAGQHQGDKVMVEMTTSKGVIELELDAKNAPITVANFIEYVKSGHYDGTIFHRVIPGFVIQGGGLKSGMG
ncbi:MAG: peptidylprolyl isomerase, partial [Arenicellales bacterium]